MGDLASFIHFSFISRFADNRHNDTIHNDAGDVWLLVTCCAQCVFKFRTVTGDHYHFPKSVTLMTTRAK